MLQRLTVTAFQNQVTLEKLHGVKLPASMKMKMRVRILFLEFPKEKITFNSNKHVEQVNGASFIDVSTT